VRESIAFFNEDLMTYAAAGRIKVYSLRPRKGLDISIFGQILGGFVLNVVVEREDRLAG
jgi:hypothetical protein